jgi:hypothetical protein
MNRKRVVLAAPSLALSRETGEGLSSLSGYSLQPTAYNLSGGTHSGEHAIL